MSHSRCQNFQIEISSGTSDVPPQVDHFPGQTGLATRRQQPRNLNVAGISNLFIEGVERSMLQQSGSSSRCLWASPSRRCRQLPSLQLWAEQTSSPREGFWEGNASMQSCFPLERCVFSLSLLSTRAAECHFPVLRMVMSATACILAAAAQYVVPKLHYACHIVE